VGGGRNRRPFFRAAAGYSGSASGVDRSHVAFRGFLPRKTTPRDFYETKVIAKPLYQDIFSDKCYATGYGSSVKVRNFRHKGLEQLYSEDSAKGVALDTVDKLRKIFAYLDNMEDAEELRALTV
jgi:hypothetical protein